MIFSDPQDAVPVKILRLNPQDNVGVATGPLAPGQQVAWEHHALRISDRIETGHKVALEQIGVGEKIIKWGLPIGSATRPIAPGEAVHLHNMKSDYLPTYTLDGTNPYLS